MTSIVPGGCLPDEWPPSQWPVLREPDPTGDDLTAPIDWMTYPHHVLHMMATTLLDLPGAVEVAAAWAKLGDELGEIGEEFAKIVETSNEGWQGPTAELAREAGRKLGEWSSEAGTSAHEASGCVSQQADNAQWARDSMPDLPPDYGPVPMIFIDYREQRPDGADAGDSQEPGGSGGTSPMSAASSPFTAMGFATAPDLLVDPYYAREDAVQRHQRAAEVMTQMQRNSAEVHGSVPSFRPPLQPEQQGHGSGDDDGFDASPLEPAESGRDERIPERYRTVEASSAPSGGPTGGPGALGKGGMPMAPPVGGGPGAGGESLARGGGYAAGGGGFAGQPAAAAGGGGAGGGSGAGARGAMGGMPMGGAGRGGGKGDDDERKRPDYLESEENLFAGEKPPTKAVLSAEPRKPTKRPDA